MVRPMGRILLGVFLAIAVAGAAHALPALQLYVEGGTYDTATQSWEVKFSEDGKLRLWAIGQPGVETVGQGKDKTQTVVPIQNVRLSIAYPDGRTPTFTLTPSTTGGFGGFSDPSTPEAATYLQTQTDGEILPQLGPWDPVLGQYTGGDLASHGIFNSTIDWQEFRLGDFDLRDSPLGDFMKALPSADPSQLGQINVYEVSQTGLAHGDVVHFDLYDSIQSGNQLKAVFAPFSHDAGATTGGGGGPAAVVPEPATLALLGTGLLGLASFCRRRRQG